MSNQHTSTLAVAGQSISGYCGLVRRRQLHLSRGRTGNLYRVHSQNFSIFRETRCRNVTGKSNVLVIGFRLRAIRSSRLLHWLFQRLCILTTPFWSGVPGFRVKLWMVDPKTKDYLGIYDWRGDAEAQRYINFLLPILRFFSVKGTVWHERLTNQDLETFLTKHQT